MNIVMLQDVPCIRNIKYSVALRRAGHKVHLICSKRDHRYGDLNLFYDSTSEYPNIRSNPSVKNTMKYLNTDILHYHNTPEMSRGSFEFYGYPYVYDCHDWRGGFKNEHKYYICVTDKMGSAMHLKSYISIPNLYTSFNTENDKTFGSKIGNADDIHVAYIGSFYYKKSAIIQVNEIERFIESHQNVVMHIYITESVIKPFVMLRLEGLPRLVVHHSIPYRDIPKELSQYDCGVIVWADYGQEHYAWPNKYSEYIISKLPVYVDKRYSVLRKDINKNKTGWAYSNIEKIDLSNVGKIKNFSCDNIDKYFIDSHVSRLVSYYSRVISSKKD